MEASWWLWPRLLFSLWIWYSLQEAWFWIIKLPYLVHYHLHSHHAAWFLSWETQWLYHENVYTGCPLDAGVFMTRTKLCDGSIFWLNMGSILSPYHPQQQPILRQSKKTQSKDGVQKQNFLTKPKKHKKQNMKVKID